MKTAVFSGAQCQDQRQRVQTETQEFHLNRKHFFTVHWNSMHREVMLSPSFEIFKIHLDIVLGNLLKVTQLEQAGWIR